MSFFYNFGVAREVVQQLRPQAALTNETVLIPSTNMVLTTICNSISRGPKDFSDLHGTRHACSMQTYMQARCSNT